MPKDAEALTADKEVDGVGLAVRRPGSCPSGGRLELALLDALPFCQRADSQSHTLRYRQVESHTEAGLSLLIELLIGLFRLGYQGDFLPEFPFW